MSINTLANFKDTVSLSSLFIPSKEDPSVSASGNFVIAFARVRTNQVNSWLTRQLKTMEDNGRDSRLLNDVLATFAQYSGGFNANEPHQTCKGALTAAIDQLPEDSPLRQRLTELRDSPGSPLNTDAKGGTDVNVIPAEMNRLIKEVENELKKVDRNSQEGQLMINSKMGELNEINQLAAMLIQQFHENCKAVLQRA